MDPYLEGPRWHVVHANLISEIARQLAPLLRPRYVAFVNERVVVDLPPDYERARKDSPYPDVAVIDAGRMSAGSTAVLAPAPLQMTTPVPERIPHYTVEVRDTKKERLVTAIEVLSATNKRGDGRKEYLKRRRRYLGSDTHLIEIDLLRRGRRVPTREPLPDLPYFVFLSRANRRPIMDVWPVKIDQALPTIPVPLLPGDADVPLDIQRAFTSAYDTFGYDLVTHYAEPPPVPLSTEVQEWANNCIRTFQAARTQ
jgi:uncharacterized protein DUF4058